MTMIRLSGRIVQSNKNATSILTFETLPLLSPMFHFEAAPVSCLQLFYFEVAEVPGRWNSGLSKMSDRFGGELSFSAVKASWLREMHQVAFHCIVINTKDLLG